MVLVGKRRNFITIQSATRTSDGQGGYTTAWAKLSDHWADAIPLNESRTLDQGGIKYNIAVKFIIRRGVTVTPDYRIVWESENYTIHSVIPSRKLDDQEITAYV